MKGLSFDDVLIVPSQSKVEHREKDIVLATFVTKSHRLQLPVISSPMDTVTSVQTIIELGKLGGLGVAHRFQSIDDECNVLIEAKKHGDFLLAAAVGATDDYIERAKALVHVGAEIIFIDIANGHSIVALRAIEGLRKEIVSDIVGPNIATLEGADAQVNRGVSALRVGLGNGAACTTRSVAGVGVPQITALQWVFNNGEQRVPIISDGGIEHVGDAVKAFAAGASTVMLGKYLAGTHEAPGELVGGFKAYRGSASFEAMSASGHAYRAPEGVSMRVPYTGTIQDVMNTFVWGLRSGMSYCGAFTIEEMHNRLEFIEITSAGMKESGARYS